MIKIQRNPLPPELPVFTERKYLSQDGVTLLSKAELEKEKAIAFFTDPANFQNDKKITKKNFKFTVYKDARLVEALEGCFHKKCAYCESEFAHITPADIEHYRPKAEIDTGRQKLRPGYYWLAADWNNLLISCPDCNRARRQPVPGQAEKVRLGKLDQFPLANDAFRVRSHTGNLVQEEPVRLLLNPCLDDPEEHLTFDDEGKILPRLDSNNQPSQKGVNSIFVYALQRKDLVERREEVLKDFRFHVDELKDNVAEKIETGSARASARIQRTVEHLKEHVSVGAEFLGLLHDYIKRAKGSGELDILMSVGIDLEDLFQNPGS